MVVGALALAEHDPAMATHMIERAKANLPRVARSYAPDGAYMEGPTYWDYGTSFHVALISALESACGDDYGLADIPGFLPSAHYMFHVTGPTGRFFNYSDGGEGRNFLSVDVVVRAALARAGVGDERNRAPGRDSHRPRSPAAKRRIPTAAARLDVAPAAPGRTR